MLHQFRRCRGRLDYRSTGCQVAPQNRDTAYRLERILKRKNDFAVITLGIVHIVPDGFTIDGQRILVQATVGTKFLKDHGKSAGIIEVLHEVLT